MSTRGRCAAALAVSTGGRAFQGSFRWHQRADALDLAVRGPLGAGVLQVSRHAERASRFTARGETRMLTDPETELSDAARLVAAGRQPARVAARPSRIPRFSASSETGADGTLASFEQRQWRVAFPTYQLATLADRHARRCSCRGASISTHGDLRLRLTVDDWHAGCALRDRTRPAVAAEE